MRTPIRDAVLLDGTGAELASRAGRLVENNRIVELNRDESSASPAIDLVIAATGGALMSGFMNVLVHFLGSAQPSGWGEGGKTPYGVEQGWVALDAGITAVTDVGAKERPILALRDHLAHGWDDPTVLACGAQLVITAGHGSPFNARDCHGPYVVREATREQLRSGADRIKISATGGAVTAIQEIMSGDADEMRMAVHKAREAGRHTYAHAHAAPKIREPVRAAARTIGHGVLIDEETLAVMLEDDAWLMPIRSSFAAIVERGPEFWIPTFMQDKAWTVTDIQAESVVRAHTDGVSTAFGTDDSARHRPTATRSCVRSGCSLRSGLLLGGGPVDHRPARRCLRRRPGVGTRVWTSTPTWGPRRRPVANGVGVRSGRRGDEP